MIFIWIIISIVLFSIIVLIHEWGHFSTARLFWVRVEEFWLWIPPRAKKLFIDKKWTLFSLNWLPIGWFVKLTWEMPNTFLVYDEKWELYNNKDLEKDIISKKDIFDWKNKKITEKDKEEILKKLKENWASYNLMNKPSWQQAIIILAWVFMNFLLAAIIFSILFFTWIKPIWINTKIETNLDLKLIPTYEQAIESWILFKDEWLILSPVEWSIAEKAWLIEWDILLSINSIKIDTAESMIEIISENKNTNVDLSILRVPYCPICPEWSVCKACAPPENIEIKIIPSELWKIGAYISENIKLNKDFEYTYSVTDSIKYWTLETFNQALLTFKWLWIIVRKIFNPETPVERQEALEQVRWPIWIVDFITNSMQAGFVFLLVIWAIISINLWVFNLLPIPALDGWRFLFITINWLIKKAFWRKAISEKTEWLIHIWFFIFLIALSLLIAYNDISKIISS